MKASWKAASLAIGCLVILGCIVQVPASRAAKMKQVESYLGKWKVEGTILMPPEIKGAKFRGKLDVGWTLNHTALEFKAKSTFDSGGKSLEASGIFTFNDADFYDKQCYTASFAWSEDGRMLPLRGDFKGKTLVLEGSPNGNEKVPLRVKATDGKDKKIDVYVVDGKKEELFIQMTLRR